MKKKIDIIMVAYNHLDDTRRALKSLFMHTDPDDFRLILINNGSLDCTSAWLSQYGWDGNDKYKNVEVIDLPENVGWITAIHNVYHMLDAPYFLTCHTDLLFEKDWLPKMLRQFDSVTYDIAMVGPVSDYILGLQSVNNNLPGFTGEYTKFICGLFCIFKKEAVDKLIEKDGFFMDPIFGFGDKEELDYAMRLTDLGYKFKIARSVFIHHDGEKGFVDKCGTKEKFHEYQDKNKEILIKKWGNERVDDIYKVDMSKRLHVCVGVPMRNSYTHCKFTGALFLMKMSGKAGLVNTLRYVIHEARNLIVEKARKDGATHILFIDDDMIFPQDAFLRLLSHDVDIVTGLAFRRSAPYRPVIFKCIDKNMWTVDAVREGLIDIDACGSAFVLIKMEVFEKMPKPWYVFGDKSLGIYEDVGGLGEDMSFSLKAKRLGFSVKCDTDLIITHIGDEEEIDDKTYLEYKEKHSLAPFKVKSPEPVETINLPQGSLIHLNLPDGSVIGRDDNRLGVMSDYFSRNKKMFDGKVVLDIGSNCGHFPIIFKALGAKKVCAIEPRKEFHDIFKKLTTINNFCDGVWWLQEDLRKVSYKDIGKVNVLSIIGLVYHVAFIWEYIQGIVHITKPEVMIIESQLFKETGPKAGDISHISEGGDDINDKSLSFTYEKVERPTAKYIEANITALGYKFERVMLSPLYTPEDKAPEPRGFWMCTKK